MRRTSLVALLVLSAAGPSVLPSVAQEADRGLERELQALVQVTTRLVEALERRELESDADRDLRRTAVAVQLLDIRTRQQEGLRRELVSLDDQEQQLQGSLVASQARAESVDLQLTQVSDEAEKLELQAQRREFDAYLEQERVQLEHLARRRTEIDGLLEEGRRMTRHVEDLVEDWLATLERTPPRRSGP